MSKHTPGPWTVQTDLLVIAVDGFSVADCERERPEDEANARLVSAAPELLTALRGEDPEEPEPIQPLGWLKTLIDECIKMHSELEVSDKDPDSFWMMIGQVQRLLNRGLAAVKKAEGTP